MRVSWKKTPCGCPGSMSPFGREMQKDDPSTKVTVPGPSGPAAVSAFQPANPTPSKQADGLTPGHSARSQRYCPFSTLLLLPPGFQTFRPGNARACKAGGTRQKVLMYCLPHPRKKPRHGSS
jgi:hypothetical protein